MIRVRIGQAALAALFVAGCLSVTPTVTPTPGLTQAVPTATPSVAPTVQPTAVPTVTPSAAPAETPRSADEVLAGLVEFSHGAVPFTLEASGTFDATSAGETASALLRITGVARGNDFDGSVDITQPGLTLTVDVVIIGDEAWVRPSGGDWQETPGYDSTQPIQPISDLALADLTYVALTYDETGAPKHTVTINRWTGGDPRTVGLRHPKLTINNYELVLNNDGYPESVDLGYRLRGRFLGSAFDATYNIHYLMSDFGLPVTIEAPI